MRKVKAVIYLDVPEYQIGEPVSVYFKDSMYIHGICEARTMDESLMLELIEEQKKYLKERPGINKTRGQQN